MTNAYYAPEPLGLELIGDVEWSDEPYQFDMSAVWQHKESGEFYMADDSGCSCPSPFEDCTSLDDLTKATKSQIIQHLRERSAITAADLIERVRARPIQARLTP